MGELTLSIKPRVSPVAPRLSRPAVLVARRRSATTPTTPTTARPRRAAARRSPWRRVLRVLLLAPVVLYGLAVLALLYVRVLPPPTTMVQTQRRIEALVTGRDYQKRMQWRPLSALPRHVPRAVVAAEDTRFYDHDGFDWEEFERAGERARRTGEARRGASTITQQLVKNLFLTTHRSVLRKAAEYALTPAAELILPKARILELYVNVIEWGPGVYGVEAAARHHYDVAAGKLTRAQATRLAAVIPAPRTRRPSRMGSYARVIDGRMRAMGW